VEKYKRNSNFRRTEEDSFPAQLFREGARWLEDNMDAERFFLMIDCFDPHEPWDPPVHYRRLYDADSDVKDLLLSPYHPWKNVMSPRELKRLQATYAGEVTLCDRWFGHFMESLKNSGRLEDTIVCVISDHGHNLGYDPGDKGYMSKQGHPATRAVMDLVCMIRHPSGEGAGTDYDGLIYNFDITRTLLGRAGIRPQKPMDGQDIWSWAIGNKPGRDHVTIGYGLTITVITDKWWYNSNAWREAELLYSWREDKDLEKNVAEKTPAVCKEMYELAKADIGGEFPAYFENYRNRSGANVNAWLNAPFGATKYSSHNPITTQVLEKLREFDKQK
jgi:arylsulfatase A-like enzyme